MNRVGKALRDKNFDILMTSSHHEFRTISFKSLAELISLSAFMLLKFSFDLQYHLINIIFYHLININVVSIENVKLLFSNNQSVI